MLTAEGCRARRRRLWDALPEQPEWIVLHDEQHLVHFANFFLTPFIFRTTNAGAILILGRDGRSILISDSMLKGSNAEAFVDEVVAPVWYRGVETAPQREALLVKTALERLKTCPGNRFGLELSKLPAGILLGLQRERPDLVVTPVDEAVHQLKRRKDADELVLIERAMKAGDAGHAAALEKVRPGMTEQQIFRLIQDACQAAAGEQVQVYGDFVTGPRCETGGGPPTDRVVAAGDLVLLDFSVIVRGYRGDFANTFVCGQAPSAELLHLQDACLEAIAAGEKLLKPGRSCKEVDEAVRGSFDRQHLREHFKSHVGHGLGLGHPDPPYFVPESTDTLLEGDVVALEPGQFIAGKCGMRFEHNYLITADGFRRLSNHHLTLRQPGF